MSNVSEYVSRRLRESNAIEFPDKSRFTVAIPSDLHENLQELATVLGGSKTALASSLLEAAIREAYLTYRTELCRSKGVDESDIDEHLYRESEWREEQKEERAKEEAEKKYYEELEMEDLIQEKAEAKVEEILNQY